MMKPEMSEDFVQSGKGPGAGGAPSIPEWYSGRSVLVTGGTGFMGKVLVEKLLRSCPELRTVYLLMRSRRGRSAHARLDDVIKLPLFGRLRTEAPDALSKLVTIEGDVMEVGLGLSPEDRSLLEREVSVVFHSAASVRFDDSVSAAILMNVRGTREVLRLARSFHDIQAFVHFSTAFSNCEYWDVGEHLYPPPGDLDWKLAISLAEKKELEPFLDILAPKLLGLKKNTYLFAKSLGEHVVNDHQHQLPVVIVRPSVVMSTFDDPIPGWIDNFNGPIATWMGAYTGVLRVLNVNSDDCLDLVPVDSAAKSIIYIAYHRALTKPSDGQLPVYNCATLVEKCSLHHQWDVGVLSWTELPTTKMIWRPSQTFTTSWLLFYVNFMFLHVLPAFFADAIMKYKDGKPRLMRMYRRMYTAVKSYIFFTKTFTFRNDKFRALEQRMLPNDHADFAYATPRKLDQVSARTTILGARVHLLKDPTETLPRARRLLRRFIWLDAALKGTLVLGIAWTVVTRPTLLAMLSSLFEATTSAATS